MIVKQNRFPSLRRSQKVLWLGLLLFVAKPTFTNCDHVVTSSNSNSTDTDTNGQLYPQQAHHQPQSLVEKAAESSDPTKTTAETTESSSNGSTSSSGNPLQRLLKLDIKKTAAAIAQKIAETASKSLKTTNETKTQSQLLFETNEKDEGGEKICTDQEAVAFLSRQLEAVQRAVHASDAEKTALALKLEELQDLLTQTTANHRQKVDELTQQVKSTSKDRDKTLRERDKLSGSVVQLERKVETLRQQAKSTASQYEAQLVEAQETARIWEKELIQERLKTKQRTSTSIGTSTGSTNKEPLDSDSTTVQRLETELENEKNQVESLRQQVKNMASQYQAQVSEAQETARIWEKELIQERLKVQQLQQQQQEPDDAAAATSMIEAELQKALQQERDKSTQTIAQLERKVESLRHDAKNAAVQYQAQISEAQEAARIWEKEVIQERLKSQQLQKEQALETKATEALHRLEVEHQSEKQKSKQCQVQAADVKARLEAQLKKEQSLVRDCETEKAQLTRKHNQTTQTLQQQLAETEKSQQQATSSIKRLEAEVKTQTTKAVTLEKEKKNMQAKLEAELKKEQALVQEYDTEKKRLSAQLVQTKQELQLQLEEAQNSLESLIAKYELLQSECDGALKGDALEAEFQTRLENEIQKVQSDLEQTWQSQYAQLQQASERSLKEAQTKAAKALDREMAAAARQMQLSMESSSSTVQSMATAHKAELDQMRTQLNEIIQEHHLEKNKTLLLELGRVTSERDDVAEMHEVDKNASALMISALQSKNQALRDKLDRIKKEHDDSLEAYRRLEDEKHDIERTVRVLERSHKEVEEELDRIRTDRDNTLEAKKLMEAEKNETIKSLESSLQESRSESHRLKKGWDDSKETNRLLEVEKKSILETVRMLEHSLNGSRKDAQFWEVTFTERSLFNFTHIVGGTQDVIGGVCRVVDAAVAPGRDLRAHLYHDHIHPRVVKMTSTLTSSVVKPALSSAHSVLAKCFESVCWKIHTMLMRILNSPTDIIESVDKSCKRPERSVQSLLELLAVFLIVLFGSTFVRAVTRFMSSTWNFLSQTTLSFIPSRVVVQSPVADKAVLNQSIEAIKPPAKQPVPSGNDRSLDTLSLSSSSVPDLQNEVTSQQEVPSNSNGNRAKDESNSQQQQADEEQVNKKESPQSASRLGSGIPTFRRREKGKK